MRPRSVRGLACASALAGAALLAAPASADILLLRDGRIVDGPKMERVEDGVVVHFENGDVHVAPELVEDVLVEGGTQEFVPRTEEEREKHEDGYVPYEGRWVRPAQRERAIERRIEEKREALEDVQAHSEWGNRYEEETRHFRWEFTVPRHVWERFADGCDAYYEAFSKEFRVKRDRRKPKLLMNFFGDRKEFHRTSGAPGGALAYFMFLGDYDLCAFHERLDDELTEMVLYHELSHYMQKLVDEGFNYPHWPGEGMAEYYGGSRWDPEKGRFEVGLVQEGRLAEIKSDISLGKYVTLESVVKEAAYTDYTWGWSLVHFFMNERKYKKGFKDYFIGLATARDVDRDVSSFNLKTVSPDESLRYLMDCLRIRDEDELAEVQRDWYHYVEEELQLTSTTGLEKAGLRAKGDGKPIQARRLLQEAIDGGSTNPMVFHALAQLTRGKDQRRARELWERATELDPLTGVFWYELGRLVEKQEEEEGRRLKALGHEIDPEVGLWDDDLILEGD